MRIVHISDVHVQLDYRSVPLRRMGWRRALAQLELQTMRRSEKYESAPGVLRQVVRDVEALGADHVILSGDLTALAADEEFAGVRDALAPLSSDPARLSLIPGNHDRFTRQSATVRRFERHFGHLLRNDLPGYAAAGTYPYVKLLGDSLAVVGLDSTQVAPIPGIVYGRVGSRQLEALERIFEDPHLRNRHALVMVHHAPLDGSGRPDRATHGLLDARVLMQRLAGRRCSLHHGHIHHRYRHAATERRPEIFGAGSSTHVGREGYWVLDFQGSELVSAQAMSPGEVRARAAHS